MKFKQLWNENKTGAFLGAPIGGAFFLLNKSKVLPQMAAINTQGIIDAVVGKVADVMTIVNIKLLVAYIIIGATVGFIASMIYRGRK